MSHVPATQQAAIPLPERRGNPLPEERVRFLTCVPSKINQSRRYKIFLAPSIRKFLPPDYNDVISKDRHLASSILIRRARQVAKVHGVDIYDSGVAFRKEARSGKFHLITSSYLDDRRNEVFAVVIKYADCVRLQARLTQGELDSLQTIKIVKWNPGRWRKVFFSAFPIEVSEC